MCNGFVSFETLMVVLGCGKRIILAEGDTLHCRQRSHLQSYGEDIVLKNSIRFNQQVKLMNQEFEAIANNPDKPPILDTIGVIVHDASLQIPRAFNTSG